MGSPLTPSMVTSEALPAFSVPKAALTSITFLESVVTALLVESPTFVLPALLVSEAMALTFTVYAPEASCILLAKLYVRMLLSTFTVSTTLPSLRSCS